MGRKDQRGGSAAIGRRHMDTATARHDIIRHEDASCVCVCVCVNKEGCVSLTEYLTGLQCKYGNVM